MRGVQAACPTLKVTLASLSVKNPTSPQCQALDWVLGLEVRKAQSPQAADREWPPQAVLLWGPGCSQREGGQHLGRLSEEDGVCPLPPGRWQAQGRRGSLSEMHITAST